MAFIHDRRLRQQACQVHIRSTWIHITCYTAISFTHQHATICQLSYALKRILTHGFISTSACDNRSPNIRASGGVPIEVVEVALTVPPANSHSFHIQATWLAYSESSVSSSSRSLSRYPQRPPVTVKPIRQGCGRSSDRSSRNFPLRQL
jgi:hypothetical protein